MKIKQVKKKAELEQNQVTLEDKLKSLKLIFQLRDNQRHV